MSRTLSLKKVLCTESAWRYKHKPAYPPDLSLHIYYYLLFIIYYLLFIIYYLLFIICSTDPALLSLSHPPLTINLCIFTAPHSSQPTVTTATAKIPNGQSTTRYTLVSGSLVHCSALLQLTQPCITFPNPKAHSLRSVSSSPFHRSPIMIITSAPEAKPCSSN